MRHLTFEQIFQLTEASNEGEGFSEEQVQELEHLKTCEDCYEQFCLLSLLNEVTDPMSGYVFEADLADARGAAVDAVSESVPVLLREEIGAAVEDDVLEPVNNREGSPANMKERVLAAIRVGCQKTNEGLRWFMEQISPKDATLRFAPAFAAATRGQQLEKSSLLFLEEFEDDKTMMSFEPENRELYVQIGAQSIGTGEINVEVVFEDNNTRIIVPMERKGKVLQGKLQKVPEGDFQIIIETGMKNNDID